MLRIILNVKHLLDHQYRPTTMQPMLTTKYTDCFIPLLKVLKDQGGSGTVNEVTLRVAEVLKVSDADLEERLPSGTLKFKNQVAWARFYLTKTGFLESSKRGVWSLTEKGQSHELSSEEVQEIVRSIGQQFAPANKPNIPTSAPEESTPVEAEQPGSYREQLLSVMQSLPPAGFERLCQRLLRESGFEQVIVTGKSGDGGIDGHGILLVNPFVSFKVMFQCKRYVGSVGAPQVRDFRGSMAGRADKGIILTTGTFTADAQREALRDGATPIELVDNEKLISMFEKLELGLTPRTTFDVDVRFFEEFSV